MDPQLIWMWLGFLLAAYAVVGNDSIQTLGTFIGSNRKSLAWYHLWFGASAVLVFTLSYGWYVNAGDISYGRLTRIPLPKVEWYHSLMPLVLLVLTRFGIPVSTSFLVLSVFSSSLVLEKMLMKSLGGLFVAVGASLAIWWILSHTVKKLNIPKNLSPRNHNIARVAQGLSTALLWAMWLTHDMANIAVFLPRQLSVFELLIVLTVLVLGLGHIFRTQGGKIQHIVNSKTNTRFVISATIIDLVYAAILFVFKEMNDIPMSTTWVFVGLLLGREVAIRAVLNTKKARKLLPMVVADLSKLVVGALVSVGCAIAVHNRWDVIFAFVQKHTFWVVAITATAIIAGIVANIIHHRKDSDDDEDSSTESNLP